MPFREGPAAPFIFATDRFTDQLNTHGEAAFIIALTKVRINMPGPNLEGRSVRQCSFKSVADLDRHFSVLDECKKHNPIPPAAILSPDAPSLGDALGVVFDGGTAFHFAEDGNHDLVGSLAFELRELGVELKGGFLRNNAGIIVEIVARLGRNDFDGKSGG